MKKLIAGNWKMNGTLAQAQALAKGVAEGFSANPALAQGCELLVCPPFPYLAAAGAVLTEGAVALGGQDCAADEDGAYTGDVSAAMLHDIGCSYVILGHSERRALHGETSARVGEKAARAHIHGLSTIICVGETEDDRTDGQAFAVVERQLTESIPDGARPENTVIAYEPVWAIGTGKTATPEDVGTMHAFIREKLAAFGKVRILYGGSVKPANAAALMGTDNVDGALVGGASLKESDFIAIAEATSSWNMSS